MKPGSRTTEFIITGAVIVGSTAAAIAKVLSPHWAAIADAISAGAYAVSRGIAKQGTPGA